ncbi:hypothetical protein MXEN_17003 [Mycobacterium xenopi RIVM700367]|uniref:hypothetical protein n=1 Tax=Mycobacterium xenopi TaxID=1789 RepID=UPI00025AE941|nr:hypothetical protein [Mycobacterium xenopi]EID10870.1 hypothetical protein MXEN_17003 [Mycobacterium xenopi RIVM700367]
MTTAASDQTATAAHPRTRSMESWRARLGVLASRGETDGPRVAEARAALTWWRHRTYLTRDMGIAPDQADALLDTIDQHAAAEVVTSV